MTKAQLILTTGLLALLAHAGAIAPGARAASPGAAPWVQFAEAELEDEGDTQRTGLVDQLDRAPGDAVREPQIDDRRPQGEAAVRQQQLSRSDTGGAVSIDQPPAGAIDRCDPANWPDGRRPEGLACGARLAPEAPEDRPRRDDRLTREQLLNELLKPNAEERNPDIISDRLRSDGAGLSDNALGVAAQSLDGTGRGAPPAQPTPETQDPIGALEASQGLPPGSLVPLILPTQ